MSQQTIPQHIAIICDGNRRWAKARGLEVFMGHKKATDEVFESLVIHCISRGVKYLTFWIFSTENWKRDKREVDFLMNLFRDFFDTRITDMDKKGVRVKVIGDITQFASDIQERIVRGTKDTENNTSLTLVLAMNYGGRDELRRAVQAIAAKVEDGELQSSDISEKEISSHLDTNFMPEPEIIVRTGGEQRLSGFMLWQCNYTEFMFPEWTFPEFSPERLDEVIAEFNHRQRRFGG